MKYGFKMSMKTMKVIKIPNDKRYDAMIQVGDELYGKILDEFKRLDSMQDRIEFATHSLVEAFKLSQHRPYTASMPTISAELKRR